MYGLIISKVLYLPIKGCEMYMHGGFIFDFSMHPNKEIAGTDVDKQAVIFVQ